MLKATMIEPFSRKSIEKPTAKATNKGMTICFATRSKESFFQRIKGAIDIMTNAGSIIGTKTALKYGSPTDNLPKSINWSSKG